MRGSGGEIEREGERHTERERARERINKYRQNKKSFDCVRARWPPWVQHQASVYHERLLRQIVNGQREQFAATHTFLIWKFLGLP